MDLEGKIWEKPYNFREPHLTFYLSFPEDTVTVVISTYNRPLKLKRAIVSVLEQTYSNFEIVIIGDNCPVLENTINELTKELLQNNTLDNINKIRWWNLDKKYNDSGTTPKNYALRTCIRTQWVAYLDDDNYWEKTHLENLFHNVNIQDSPNEISYAFIMGKYKIICKQPKLYRIDTSCIMHRTRILIKYGFWRTPKDVGYSHDWELVSRWENEKYVATLQPTVNYDLESSLNNPQKIFAAYDDQCKNYIDTDTVPEDSPQESQSKVNQIKII